MALSRSNPRNRQIPDKTMRYIPLPNTEKKGSERHAERV